MQYYLLEAFQVIWYISAHVFLLHNSFPFDSNIGNVFRVGNESKNLGNNYEEKKLIIVRNVDREAAKNTNYHYKNTNNVTLLEVLRYFDRQITRGISGGYFLCA